VDKEKNMIQLRHKLIEIELINNQLQHLTECGGHVWFVGTVRSPNENMEITKLFFEAYKSMAIKELEAIKQEAIQKFELQNLLIHHRLGAVFAGEIAVVVVASSIHRKAAFLGCEFAIDELKKRVPIWKKEFGLDQSNWVSSSKTP
jgi:molybdopterin synthase catalytic subunit